MLINLMYPHKCTVCRSFLKQDFWPICPRCQSGMLGHSFVKEENNLVYIEKIIGLFPYEEDYKRAVQRWKYQGIRKYGKSFATLLANKIACDEAFKDIQCIVPVPLSKSRYRQRGFNQARDLAQELSVRLGIPLQEALVRHRDTKPQAGLEKKERAINLSRSMSLSSKKSLKGVTKIALVDDIYTTGSTIKECIRAIMEENEMQTMKQGIKEIEISLWVVCKAT